MGVLNGTMMIPLTLFSRDMAIERPGEFVQLSYLFSFGVGVLIVTPPVSVFFFLVRREKPVFHFPTLLLPAVVAGCFWA